METNERRLENLAEVGYKARKEAEDFVNHWLNDSTTRMGGAVGFG